MNPAPHASPLAQRTAALLLFAGAALALANLPARDLPPGWLLAFTLPGAVLGLLRSKTRQPWQRAMLAIALQAGACWLALSYHGPMTRPAALACTILPPLAFVTMRREQSDGALGLFLSFCVLLVGIILDGIHLPLLAAYGTAACLSLCSAAHLAAVAASKPPALAPSPRVRPGNLLLASCGITIACLLAAAAIERTLGLLPSPSGPGRSSASNSTEGRDGSRTVGLGDSFVLGGGLGVLSELRGEQLVRVRAADGSPLPADLYLRSGFFATPGLDRWQLGSLARTKAPAFGPMVLREPQPQVSVTWLEFERLAGARNFVFVPPDTCEIRGVEGLVVDVAREWLRQDEGLRPSAYQVGYQRLDEAPLGAIEPVAASQGLLTLPLGLDRQPFDELLAAWRVSDQPLAAMQRIAAGLAERCRYDRIEPVGPYPLAILNFLFAEGDRRGYCMHFASAAALMLRLRGIPCRIGVGLYGGDVDPQAARTRVYGSQHAHAWVEVPFAGRGYVVFDPTPPVERGRRTPSRLETAPPSEVATAAPASRSNLLRDAYDLLTEPWLLALALLLALLSSLWPAASRRPVPVVTPTSAKPARRWLVRILRALADAGHVRGRGQTIESFARDLARRNRLPPEVEAAFVCYQEVRFGGRPFDAERERVLLRGLEAVRHP